MKKNRIMLSLAVLLAAGLFASSAQALTWGVGGHPWMGGAFGSDTAQQLTTLQARGFTTYRFDVGISTDPSVVPAMKNMISQAKAHRITLHPILHVPFSWGDATFGGRYPNTQAGLEAQGYNLVYPFVLQFAGDIRDWELDNEVTLKGIKSGIGRSASDYNTTAAQQWAAILRGMSRAVHDAGAKSGHPTRTVVDIPYVDFGFFPFLAANKVVVDKVGYHYYYWAATSPYQIVAPNGVIDLFAELKKLGKPVIINEFNASEIYLPNQGKPYDDNGALLSLQRHSVYLSTQTEANIEGIEFYELYNEPGKGAVESNFGLMKDPSTPKMQMLMATVYACGTLTSAERAQLVAARWFTTIDLNNRIVACMRNK